MFAIRPLAAALGLPAAKPATPAAPAKPAALATKAGDGLALKSHPGRKHRLVPGKDALVLSVRPGDTLSKLARRWSAAPEGRASTLGAVVGAIRSANGLTGDGLKVGQALRIPLDPSRCNVDLEMALAIQKDAGVRKAKGERLPAVDAAGLSWHPGPLDSYLATAPRKDGQGVQHYAIADDQEDETGMSWLVRPIDQAEYEKLSHGDLGN
jgi:hypothetical protein